MFCNKYKDPYTAKNTMRECKILNGSIFSYISNINVEMITTSYAMAVQERP